MPNNDINPKIVYANTLALVFDAISSANKAEASLPAVEICSDNSVPGQITSIAETR